MAEEKVESPVLEKPEVTNQNDAEINELVSLLEKAGVTDASQLQGKLDASAQVGQMANLLGDARRRIEELESRPHVRQQVKQEDQFDLDRYGEGQTINLEETLDKVLEKRETKKQREMLQLQQQGMQMWNAIQNDPDYGLVRQSWEGKMSDPRFAMDIQRGAVNPYLAYQQTVREFYKGIAQKSLDTIKNLRGVPTVNTPYVEAGPRSANMVTDRDDGRPTIQKRINQLKEKAHKSGVLTSDDELELAELVGLSMR